MTSPVIEIVSLDMEARGVGHLPNEDGSPGKVIFVEGALPGDRFFYHPIRSKKPRKAEASQGFLGNVNSI